MPIRYVLDGEWGKLPYETAVTQERWNGCDCVWPGKDACECQDNCPCKRVTPSSMLKAPKNLNLFDGS